MAHRKVHYEAAFEDYLRARGWPYVVVDEAKKAIFGSASIKSFDFVVYSELGPNLLVDVKGRKFPDRRGGAGNHSKAWENWITGPDANGLQRWQEVFGEQFAPVLVFAYWLQGPPQRAPFADVHFFRGKHYAFVAVALEDYLAESKARSARWDTLGVPGKRFAKIAKRVEAFL